MVEISTVSLAHRSTIGFGALLLLALLVAAGCASAADRGAGGAAPSEVRSEEAPEAPRGWYVSTIVSSDAAFRITHYWSKGSSMRAETMIGIHPVVTIVRGDRYWVYDELRRVGVEIGRAPEAIADDAKRSRPFGNDLENLIRDNGEQVDTMAMNGVAVEVWRVTNNAGRRTVWVTANEPRLPIRVENFDRSSGATAALEYTNWTPASTLPEQAFEPPADLELQKFEYQQYMDRTVESQSGAPVLFPHLLHGSAPR